MKKVNLLSKAEMKKILGGVEPVIPPEEGCNSVGEMCESHFDCCQPRGKGCTVCMLSLSTGYGTCTAWCS